MSIKTKLENQLERVEFELRRPSSDEESATLQVAKATILMALQKYEE